jgi:threonine synthase
MACLAAAAGLEVMIFVPEIIPRAKIVQLMVYGAKVCLVKGDYSQAFALCKTISQRQGWFNRSTGTNPYTREGKKTVSFEIWEQMGYQCPDVVIVTVGDGNIISGVYKGFFDLHQAGIIPRIPRIIGVQAQGSAAISDAFLTGKPIRKIQAHTIADSISAGYPSDGQAALNAVRASGGTFVVLPDTAILDSILLLARTEGIFAEPSGAAGVEAARYLAQTGALDSSDKVVVIATGNGLKDVDAAQNITGLPDAVDPNLCPDRILDQMMTR